MQRPRTLVLSLALFVALPSASLASAQATPESGRVRGFARQQLNAVFIGLEHAFFVGVRGSLGDQADILFGGAHAEVGLSSYLTPVYAQHGGYVEVSPFAFLVLRAELIGSLVWPLGLASAGYYGLSSYDAGISEADLPSENAGSASGWSLRLTGALQGIVPIASDVRVLVADELMGQRAELGGASHYYDMKWDLVVARADWLLVNSGVVLLEIDPDPSRRVQLGVYDDARIVPASGYFSHQVGVLGTFAFLAPIPEVRALTLFLRVGYLTHHKLHRDELTVLGGVLVEYDLGALR